MNTADLHEPYRLSKPTHLAVAFAIPAANSIGQMLSGVGDLDPTALRRYLDRRDFSELQERCTRSFLQHDIEPALASEAAALSVWCFREALSAAAAEGFTDAADACRKARAAAIDLGRNYAADFGDPDEFDRLVDMNAQLAAAGLN